MNVESLDLVVLYSSTVSFSRQADLDIASQGVPEIYIVQRRLQICVLHPGRD